MTTPASSDGNPQAVWVFPPPRKPQGGKLFVIILLSLVAIAIVAGFLYFFLGMGRTQPSPAPSSSASASPIPTPTPGSSEMPTPPDGTTPEPTTPPESPQPDDSASPAPEPTEEPPAPPVDDSALQNFIALVQPRLDDARTGLDLAEQNPGANAVPIVDQLIQDAGRLAEAAPPESHADAWSPAVSDYAIALEELRRASEAGESTEWPLANARAAADQLRALLGI